jgi:hypothetical protein
VQAIPVRIPLRRCCSRENDILFSHTPGRCSEYAENRCLRYDRS